MGLDGRELETIRRMVREGKYVSTHHASDEMIADDLRPGDIEHVVSDTERLMKAHYDFSKGVRGKVHRPDAVLRTPVYLGEWVETYLAAKAAAKGVELAELVNDLLRREIEIIEAVR